eukprot:SM000039S14453  [mRNA]  locus=s39:197052:199458:+ [translate_table: standard]
MQKASIRLCSLSHCSPALLVAARVFVDLGASAGPGLLSGTLVASRSEASLSLGASSVEASAPEQGKQHESGLLKQRAGSDMPIPYNNEKTRGENRGLPLLKLEAGLPSRKVIFVFRLITVMERMGRDIHHNTCLFLETLSKFLQIPLVVFQNLLRLDAQVTQVSQQVFSLKSNCYDSSPT